MVYATKIAIFIIIRNDKTEKKPTVKPAFRGICYEILLGGIAYGRFCMNLCRACSLGDIIGTCHYHYIIRD